MKQEKWQRRDKKNRKGRYGHTVCGKSVFLIVEVQAKRDAETISKSKKGGKNES